MKPRMSSIQNQLSTSIMEKKKNMCHKRQSQYPLGDVDFSDRFDSVVTLKIDWGVIAPTLVV